jgi:hypothetical protein
MDHVLERIHGTNVTYAIYKFQECIVLYKNAGFDGGNPDLGGIGVCLGSYHVHSFASTNVRRQPFIY